jgi:hypothetical protein
MLLLETKSLKIATLFARCGGKAIAQFNGNVESSNSVWFIDDSIGWQLINVVQIEPVWCKGQENLWNLPDKILQKVRINYLESIAAKSKY